MSKTIVKAAIKIKDEIIAGYDHGECFSRANFPIPTQDLEQGFIDSNGNFVDRKQAMIIAKEAGQLRYTPHKETLISEDLHLDWLNKQASKINELEKTNKRLKKNWELSRGQQRRLYNTLKLQLIEKEEQLLAKEKEIVGRRKLCDLRYEQLKQSHQDKISFAVEQLEKAKAELTKLGQDYSLNFCGIKIYNFIDDQINELKSK